MALDEDLAVRLEQWRAATCSLPLAVGSSATSTTWLRRWWPLKAEHSADGQLTSARGARAGLSVAR
jgi:hypothetical protein